MASFGHFWPDFETVKGICQIRSQRLEPKMTKNGQNNQKRPNRNFFLVVFNLQDLIRRTLLTVLKSDQKWPNEAIFRNDISHLLCPAKNGLKRPKTVVKTSPKYTWYFYSERAKKSHQHAAYLVLLVSVRFLVVSGSFRQFLVVTFCNDSKLPETTRNLTLTYRKPPET